MVLWVVFAVMTGVAILAVLAPLTRGRSPARSGQDSDLAVYKDQLREIDADLARGVIDASEAGAARAEVGRRLLAADRAAQEARVSAAPVSRAVVTAVIVLVPAISLGTYLVLGSPNLPGQPLSARMERPPQEQDVEILIAKVEDHLADEPEDGRGWEVLAPVYMRLGRFDDSVNAYANALRLLGSTAEREADFGEALVTARDGVVSEEARAAFARALAHDPKMPRARYFVAIAAEQDGDTDMAKRLWRALLLDSPSGAPWRATVEQRLAALDGPAMPGPSALDPNALGSNSPGPSSEDIAAAQDMSAEDRGQMIAGMVERLAGRLAEDGKDLDGWLRLARAYVVLGEPDKARDALTSARDNFPDDAAAAGRIDDAARSLGLESS
ncbi:c-type cytochrome biogenesis protein CcmI [Microbaculum sp. FT89]|uniref:c-type cytochrome biogenesis protein CcmI n=1 Tax=Microbaculum sp. FT89 TaxID=3447298 RepID=UPI003F52D6AF